MVVQLQDLDDLGVRVRVVLGEVAEETLGATQKGALVLLAIDNLGLLVCNRPLYGAGMFTCLSML